jgi:phospholipid/cholesterol/gamma-HCH transport system substrate-binding protein
MMSSQRSLEIKVGLVSLTAIIIFILGITFGRGYNVSVNQRKIKLRFENSGGIQQTQPVVINGVKRGIVEFVKNDNGSVLIEATIDDIRDLHKDVTAEISMQEITGGKKIEIHPGISLEPYDITKEIPGTTAADFSVLLSSAGKIAVSADTLINKIETLVNNVNNLFGEGTSKNEIELIVSNTKEMVELLNIDLKQNNGKINQIINNINELSSTLKKSVDKNEPKISSIIDQLDSAIKDFKSLSNQANHTLNGVDELVGGLKNYSDKIQNSNGTLSKLLFDKEFASRIDSTLTNLQELIQQIKKYGINANIRLGTRP